jgi:hypothetical protein
VKIPHKGKPMGMNKEEKQDFIKNRLIEIYTSWINKEEDEDGPITSLGLYSFTSGFDEISGGSCYDIHEMLKKNGVLPEGTKHDNEHSCCYYYFPDMTRAILFIDRLANFMLKRMKIATDMMFQDNFDWFEKMGCFNFPA